MNKRIVGLLFAVALLVAPAWGIQVGVQDFLTQIGVRLAASGKSINVEPGQTIKATIASPTTLATHGLKGTKKDDGVLVKLFEQYGAVSCTVEHVPSGRAVKITYRPK